MQVIKQRRLFQMAGLLALAVCFGSGARAGVTAPQFTGNNSYVALGNPDALQIPSGFPFTVEGWMRFNAFKTVDMLYSKNNPPPTRGTTYTYMFGVRNAGTLMSAYTGAGGTPLNTWRDATLSPALATDQWVHLAYVFDGAQMHFFRDGQIIGSQPYAFGNTETHTVSLGGYIAAADLNGRKSDVRVWEHARTAIQIRDFRHRRLTGVEPGLLGYWRLDEGEGTDAFDATANASTGTLVNASWPVDSDLLLPYFALLLDLQTGSPLFTNSNEVEVLLPLPALGDYDLHQFTESNLQPTGGWLAFNTSSPPATLTFAVPDPEGDVTVYAWFTNSAAVTPINVYSASIHYVKQTADVTSVARDVPVATFGASQPARIHPFTVNDGSASSIGIYAMWVDCPDDETPGEDYVTLTAAGSYTVTLTVMDMAGNTDSDAAVVTVVDGTAAPAAYLWEVPQDRIEARATSIWRELVPARTLHAPSFWQIGRNAGELHLPQALIYDLRRDYPIGGFSIYVTAYRPKAYTVYVTDEFSTGILDWGEPVTTGELPEATAWHHIPFGTTRGRYLVVRFTESYTSNRMTVNEFKVFADRPFVLAAPATGNTHYTNTETVDVANFPVLAGYDLYQVAASDVAPAAADPNWLAYDPDTPPATVTFDVPDPEGEVTLHAWFRDSTDTLPPTGFPTVIAYVRDTADVQAAAPAAVTAYAWDETAPALIRAFDLREQVPPQHEPYLGGASSSSIGLHALTVSCPQDETPARDDLVTLSQTGVYTVTLTATDSAGNQHATPVAVTVKDQAARVAATRIVADWADPPSTRTWPLAHAARGPYPPYPLRADWNMAWPQPWLIDYITGESWLVNLWTESDALGTYGHFTAHHTLYAYLENSLTLDIDARVAFATTSTGVGALLARFHPDDPRTTANTRRGYMLRVNGADGQVALLRISGGSQIALGSLAAVFDRSWSHGRLLVERIGGDATRLRAKVWRIDQPEPDAWMLDVTDSTPDLQNPGLIGVYGSTTGNRWVRFRDLEAKPLFRGTLILIR